MRILKAESKNIVKFKDISVGECFIANQTVYQKLRKNGAPTYYSNLETGEIFEGVAADGSGILDVMVEKIEGLFTWKKV